MSNITDEELMAMADGELTGARLEEIAMMLENDGALQTRFAAILDNDARIRDAFAGILDQPIPPAMLEKIAASSPSNMAKSNVVNLADARRASPRPSGYWATGLAMAASLAVGLFAGNQLLTVPGSGGPGANGGGAGNAVVVASADGPVASPRLAAVLSTVPGGAAESMNGAGRARMNISFQDHDGRLCRQFSVEGQSGATDGAACLQNGRWRIEAVGGRPIESGAFRTASGDAAEAVLSAVDALIAGDPLDAAAEAKALKSARR